MSAIVNFFLGRADQSHLAYEKRTEQQDRLEERFILGALASVPAVGMLTLWLLG